MKTLQELKQLYQWFRTLFVAYRGGLRLHRQATITKDVHEHFAQLSQENQAIRFAPAAEQTRIKTLLRTELIARRMLAVRHARHQMQGLQAAADEWRQFIENRRRDVRLSMPDALNGLSADGMVNLALLRSHTEQTFSKATPTLLLAVYEAALQRKDARALVEAEVIESIAEHGPLAKTEADRKPAKELRDLIDAVETMRLPQPDEMLDFDGLAEQVQSLHQRADALHIFPPAGDDAEALEAFNAEHDALLAAGSKPDAEDQAAYRQQLQGIA